MGIKCKDVAYDEHEAAYLNTKPHCHYCGITIELTKRGRGRKLELKPLETNEKYSNFEIWSSPASGAIMPRRILFQRRNLRNLGGDQRDLGGRLGK